MIALAITPEERAQVRRWIALGREDGYLGVMWKCWHRGSEWETLTCTELGAEVRIAAERQEAEK
jgi:hypothetical protein